MLGNLYKYINTNIVGDIPVEFEFIVPIIVIIYCVIIVYACFSGFILLNSLINRK